MVAFGSVAVVICRTAAFTVKLAASVAVSPPVVRVTVRVPSAAEGSIRSEAVAVIRLLTVRLCTVMPAPKVADVMPCAKLVAVPVTVTESVCARRPEVGFNEEITALPACTVKLAVLVAVSAPVLSVTSRGPSVAVPVPVILTVACELSVTVTLLMVMPVPKFAVVVPAAKLVKLPSTAMSLVCP